MIELSGIDKFYTDGTEQKHVLKQIEMSVSEGDFISVCGTSGCGKTTLLNIIGGLDRYTDGDLYINGKSTKNHIINFSFQA